MVGEKQTLATVDVTDALSKAPTPGLADERPFMTTCLAACSGSNLGGLHSSDNDTAPTGLCAMRHANWIAGIEIGCRIYAAAVAAPSG